VELEKAGPSPAEVLFDFIAARGMEFDTLYRYEALQEAVQKPRRALYALMVRVSRRLGREHKRRLVNIPNVGYRILRAEEHDGQAIVQVSKARRRTQAAVSLSQDADTGVMTPAQRDRHDTIRSGLLATQRAVVYLAGKIERVERVQSAQQEFLAGHDERLERLEEELRALRAETAPDAG